MQDIISRFTGFCGLWLEVFIAFTFHLVIHIGQTIVIKKYVPAVITSVVCLPLSIWLIAISISKLSYSSVEIFTYSLVGIVVVAGNLKIAHGIMRDFLEELGSDKVGQISIPDVVLQKPGNLTDEGFI